MSNGKRALFLWGGMEFHEPHQTSKRFAARLGDRGYNIDITNDMAVLDDAERLQANDLIVVNITMGEMSDAQEANLLATIMAGTGLGGWHGGLADTFRTRTGYQYAVGGQWVAHPGDITDYTVQVVDEHEITAGISEFAMHSEQYYLHVDPAVQVLATTTFDGAHDPWIKGTVMPVAWTKMFGAGKVFYCSLGHVNADFETNEAALLVEQGLVWATR
jgi:type 1 glutamine amidotransferase